MNMRNFFFSSIALAIIALPLVSQAATVVRTGESVNLNADQNVADDFYAAGNRVIVSGGIGGDMYALGGSVTVNGKIESDLTLVSGTVSVHAPVGEDVRILGGDVVIADEVGGDVFVIGGDVSIVSTASVKGDVFVLGGSVTIEAPVEGSIMGKAGSLRIDSQVNGDVDVTIGDELVLGDQASIAGDIRYVSSSDLVRSQQAVVEGEVAKNSPAPEPSTSAMSWLTPLLMMLFGALVVFLFFRDRMTPWSNATIAHYGRNGLLGLGLLLVAPFAVMILLVSVLGTFVGVVGLGLLVALYGCAFLMLPIIGGALISRLYQSRMSVSLITIAFGALAILVLLLIPVVGPLVLALLYLVTLGSLVSAGYVWFRS